MQRFRKCPNCKGIGYEPCTFCKGKGCPVCGMSGYNFRKKCHRCEGKGKLPISPFYYYARRVA